MRWYPRISSWYHLNISRVLPDIIEVSWVLYALGSKSRYHLCGRSHNVLNVIKWFWDHWSEDKYHRTSDHENRSREQITRTGHENRSWEQIMRTAHENRSWEQTMRTDHENRPWEQTVRERENIKNVKRTCLCNVLQQKLWLWRGRRRPRQIKGQQADLKQLNSFHDGPEASSTQFPS